MTLRSRPATAADIARFYPGMTSSFRAWVCELDGEVQGIIGVALLRPIACLFTKFNEVLRPYLKHLTILRLIKKVESAVRASTSRVWAAVDPAEPTSPVILKRLGFHEIGVIDGDLMYEWRRGG